MKLLYCPSQQLVKVGRVNSRPQISFPLGVLSMAAFLRESAWNGEIVVYDARLGGKVTTQENGVKVFGDTDHEVATRLLCEAPDIIGISNMFTSQFDSALRFADISRKVCPDAKVVIGVKWTPTSRQ